MCGSLSITAPLSHLANEFNVRSKLHGQVSLQLSIKFCVVYEAMNGCKKSKGSLKACFENVNILLSSRFSLHLTSKENQVSS